MDVVKVNETRTGKPRLSERTCVGCGKAAAPEVLVRLVAGPSESGDALALAVDIAVVGGSAGRGAYVHAASECLKKACRGGFSRSFRGRVQATPEDLAAQIVAAVERRVAGLLVGARRARKVAVGADAAKEALVAGAKLVLLASDAGSIATQREIVAVAAEGRAAVFARKELLGTLFARDEVAIVALLDDGIANEVRRALSMADAVSHETASATGDGFGRGVNLGGDVVASAGNGRLEV